MSRMMTENGSAVMQRRDDEDVPQGVETADHEQDGAEDGQQQPPDHLRPLVRVEVASSEIMPRANVAESAEVTRNEMMSSTDRIDRGLSRGVLGERAEQHALGRQRGEVGAVDPCRG